MADFQPNTNKITKKHKRDSNDSNDTNDTNDTNDIKKHKRDTTDINDDDNKTDDDNNNHNDDNNNHNNHNHNDDNNNNNHNDDNNNHNNKVYDIFSGEEEQEDEDEEQEDDEEQKDEEEQEQKIKCEVFNQSTKYTVETVKVENGKLSVIGDNPYFAVIGKYPDLAVLAKNVNVALPFAVKNWNTVLSDTIPFCHEEFDLFFDGQITIKNDSNDSEKWKVCVVLSNFNEEVVSGIDAKLQEEQERFANDIIEYSEKRNTPFTAVKIQGTPDAKEIIIEYTCTRSKSSDVICDVCNVFSDLFCAS